MTGEKPLIKSKKLWKNAILNACLQTDFVIYNYFRAIEIEEFNYPIFHALIYYFYTDRIESMPVGDMQGMRQCCSKLHTEHVGGMEY